jgi:hypothetical protein
VETFDAVPLEELTGAGGRDDEDDEEVEASKVPSADNSITSSPSPATLAFALAAASSS